MTKILVDVDDEALADAAEAFGTDQVAAVTGQPVRWIAPAGTIK